MKKSFTRRFYGYFFTSKKILRTMKLVTLFIIISTFSMAASNAFSQSKTLDLNIENGTIKEVLLEIKKQTNVSFLYNNKELNDSERVTLNVRDNSVDNVLSLLLKKQNLVYSVENNVILIYKPETGARVADKTLQANRRLVKGIITDERGEPIVGATIMEKGTTNGVITDMNGVFTLQIPGNGALLQVTYIGYATQEVTVKNQSDVRIVLKEDLLALDEVVVVGYGTMRKKDLTGSIMQIRPDNIANETPKTVQDILRGSPGLSVGYDASAKGGGSMMLRGQRSVYTDGGHKNPLLILDGMIFYGELSEINPDDIAQIDILKDASATAIYGARAASGVIIIVTKKGKEGKPVINVTTNIGWTEKSTYRERFGTDAYMQHRQDWFTKNTYGVNPETGVYEAYQTGVYTNQPGYFIRPDQLPSSVSIENWRAYTSNLSDESDLSIWGKRMGLKGNALDNYLAGRTVDWAKKSFRTGFNQDYNASVSGASEKVNYYLSMGYLNNEGAVISDSYRAVRANMKIDAKVNKWFEIGANVNFQDRSDGNIDMDLDQSLRNSPYADYADETGKPVQYPLSSDFNQRGYNYDFQKQYLELEKGYTVLNSILNAKVKLPFNITYTFNASPRYQFFYDRYFMSASLPDSNPKDRGGKP